MDAREVAERAAAIAILVWQLGLAVVVKALRANGLECDVCGDGDAKTLLPGFYRPVGTTDAGTCPESCDLQDVCYAQAGCGRVWLSARRSIGTVESMVVAAVACGVVSVMRDGHPARALISGDLCRDGVRDDAAIAGLQAAGDAVADVTGETGDALYGYTHLPDADVPGLLAGHHVAVLRSGLYVPGGAVVYPVERIGELQEQHPELRLVACLHATRGRVCRSCRICDTAPRKGHTVVLAPSGHRKREVARRVTMASPERSN